MLGKVQGLNSLYPSSRPDKRFLSFFDVKYGKNNLKTLISLSIHLKKTKNKIII